MPLKKGQNKKTQVSKNPPKMRGKSSTNPGANPSTNMALNPAPSSTTNPPTTDTTRKAMGKDTLNSNMILALKTKKEAISAKKYLVTRHTSQPVDYLRAELSRII